MKNRSIDFQEALLDLLIQIIRAYFFQQVKNLLNATTDPKVFAHVR